MNPVIIGEAVIAEWHEYGEKVMTGLSYQEAKEFCVKNSWKMTLYGRECALRIGRDDEKLTPFTPLMKM